MVGPSIGRSQAFLDASTYLFKRVCPYVRRKVRNVKFPLHDFYGFLVACTRLYTLPCRSVGRSVGPSVGPSHFWIPSGFRITAPAQHSATGLPCIRPCFTCGRFFIVFSCRWDSVDWIRAKTLMLRPALPAMFEVAIACVQPNLRYLPERSWARTSASTSLSPLGAALLFKRAKSTLLGSL